MAKMSTGGKIATGLISIAALVFILNAAGVQVGELFAVTGEEKAGEEFKYDYSDSLVKENLVFSDKYNGTDVNPTVYIYSEQPSSWENARQDPASGYEDTGSASSGTYTAQLSPGTYYVRAELSGYYTEFFTIDLPQGSDAVNLNDYNSEPESTVQKMAQQGSISISNVDLGVSTNESSDITYTKVATATVSSDTEFRLDEIKLQEDGTYVIATDSDGDGTYDEGVNKVKVIVDGSSYVPFEAASSVDDFAGNDEAEFDNNKVFTEEETISITYKITADQTLTSTGSNDEKLGDGETIINSAILVDQLGTTDSHTVTG